MNGGPEVLIAIAVGLFVQWLLIRWAVISAGRVLMAEWAAVLGHVMPERAKSTWVPPNDA